MFFFTGCTCRKAKSSRRTLREKSLSAVGDACKRQSTTELCGTSGFDSSGSFSIVLNYGPHSPTVFRQVWTSSSLSKTTPIVRKITFSLFKKLCVYHSHNTFLAAKGCQGCKDVISNELLHWFIQKSRFLLLQRLLLAVFLIKFVPSDARSYKKTLPGGWDITYIWSYHFLYLIEHFCTVLPENFVIQQPYGLVCQLLFGKAALTGESNRNQS